MALWKKYNGKGFFAEIAEKDKYGNDIADSLADKVDKVSGKGLSTNDYTTEEKTKLAGVEDGAQVNVQADWSETNTSADSYIQNKPTIPAAQIQSDWTQSDNTALDYIKNKPASMAITAGTGISVTEDQTTHDLVIAATVDPSTKADKVSGATSGNFAGLDANGNLTDSGSKAADFATAAQGALAETAVQPGTLATVATTGDYDDLSNKPDLGVYATKTELEGKVDKVEGKQLSTEDYTTEEKDKLSGIEDGAQANTVETVSVNGGTKASPDADKNVDLSVRELPTPTTANSMLFFDGTGDWKEVQWKSRTFS